MKKFLSLLMVVMMLASMLTVSTSAADSKLYKTMEEAQKGDLLWVVDFNATDIINPVYNELGSKNIVVTVGDNGRSATMLPAEGAAASGAWYWGSKINGLNLTNDAQYTVTFKIKSFGDTGSNNSVGVYGFRYDNTKLEQAEPKEDGALGIYGNWTSNDAGGVNIANRARLMVKGTGKSPYSNVIDTIEPDADGFVTVQIEYNVAEAEYTASFQGKDGKWVEDPDAFWIMESLDDIPDEVCFLFYGYYNKVSSTVKDIKYFKGINLTDAQLAQEAPKAVETTTAAPVTTKAPTTTAAPATTKAPAATPSTADATTYIVLACAAIAVTMTVAAKKKEH